MKPLTMIAAPFLCVCVCGKAKAQTTGIDLQQKCKSLMGDKPTSSFDNGFCAGFITAAIADETMWQAFDRDQGQIHVLNFCFPDNGTNGQALQVLIKYLDEHPEELHKPAIFILHEAFNAAFPCGK